MGGNEPEQNFEMQLQVSSSMSNIDKKTAWYMSFEYQNLPLSCGQSECLPKRA